jgi:hypothetical protein
MTGPNESTSPDTAVKDQRDRAPRAHEAASQVPVAPSGSEIRELARTQDDVAQRARRLVAGELVRYERTGHDEQQRVDQLLDSVRADLLADLRGQEQERARHELAAATRSSEGAVAGVVRGVTTIVPAALVRPEDLIEATFVLADQGLGVGRRLALTMATNVRSLSPAA